MNKSYRQSQILKLIRGRNLHTQDELARALRALKIPATQVTLSRDIRELGLVKTASGYSTGGGEAGSVGGDGGGAISGLTGSPATCGAGSSGAIEIWGSSPDGAGGVATPSAWPSRMRRSIRASRNSRVRMRSREPIARTIQTTATPTVIRLISSAIVVKPWR